MIARLLLVALAATLATGCASKRCGSTSKDYEQAQTLPPLKSVDGLKVPESASAMKIPAPTAAPAAPADEDACIEVPPRLKDAPEPTESAPAAPAAQP